MIFENILIFYEGFDPAGIILYNRVDKVDIYNKTILKKQIKHIHILNNIIDIKNSKEIVGQIKLTEKNLGILKEIGAKNEP